MSITTAVPARDVTNYTTKLDSYLLRLRSACANQEAYEVALKMAKDRAEEACLTLIEAIQLTEREIGSKSQFN